MHQFLFLASEAGEIVAKTATNGGGAPDTTSWKVVAVALMGAAILRIVQWLTEWLTKGGQKKLTEALESALKASNATAIGAQIQADDAVIKILEDAIPVVLKTTTSNLRKDLEDGRLDKDSWTKFHERVWEEAKPQIVGGANDYLKNSSFDDAKTVVKMVIARFFSKNEG